MYISSLNYIVSHLSTILYKQIGEQTTIIINKQTNKQTNMSKITTLVILLIAAATSSSSASNSSIESKVEEESATQSSLIIDNKSSGKPNNKEWSFEEFEHTMEVRFIFVFRRSE